MPVLLDPTTIENLQSIEAVVSGPDGANRLFTITGTIRLHDLGVQSNANNPSTDIAFSLHVGPTLTRRQFHRAIGSAYLSGSAFGHGTGSNVVTSWTVVATDADWDDEAGRVQLRFEVSLVANGDVSISAIRVGFHVTILAELAAA